MDAIAHFVDAPSSARHAIEIATHVPPMVRCTQVTVQERKNPAGAGSGAGGIRPETHPVGAARCCGAPSRGAGRRGYGSANTVSVIDPGCVSQKPAAMPETTATYWRPSTA